MVPSLAYVGSTHPIVSFIRPIDTCELNRQWMCSKTAKTHI